MTSNVITFPQRMETIEVKNEIIAGEEANDFANQIIEIIHNALHDQTGECMFTDPEYKPMTICIGEVISALYMLSQGHNHPFLEIANEIFGDEVDIPEEEGYTGENANNEEP